MRHKYKSGNLQYIDEMIYGKRVWSEKRGESKMKVSKVR